MNREVLYDWGLEVICWMQQFQSPFLTLIMQVISFFSTPAFYFGVVLLLYWCLDSRAGFKLGVAIIFSGALNTAIKEVLQVPRPFIRDSGVFMVEESGFSTPSGHSQGSATFYPLFAKFVLGARKCRHCKLGKKCGGRRKLPLCVLMRLWVAVGLPLLIGVSRIYLGVHYPSDVLLGLTLGFLTSVGIILFWKPVAKSVSNWRASLQLLLVAVVVFLLNHFSGSHTSLNGALLGFLVGRIFWNRKALFWDASGTFVQRLLRLPVGLVVTGVVFGALELVKNLAGQLVASLELQLLLKFIQFAGTGFVVVYLCPLLFVRLGIALPKSGEEKKNDSEACSTGGCK